MQIEEAIRPFAPGRFPNPTVMNAYINSADIEFEDGTSEVKNVLSSGSGIFYEFSIVIKKSIYGLVVKANILTPTEDGLFVRSGNVVAIKVCSKDVLTRIGGVSLENPVFEIGAMQDMGEPRHPNLACQFECCMDEKNIYSVLKFHQGVELFDHILNCGPLREESARCMFQQLVLGLHRLHSRGIAHRDVSLENIMYHAPDHATVLIDFGLCVKLQHDPLTRDFVPIRNSACGKGYYMPPESDWTGRHPQPVNPLQGDVWSVGMCLLYALLGFPPIERACDDDSRYNFLTQGRLCELLEHWDVTLSSEVVDLIQMILRPDPSERPNLAQIWSHGWMTQDGFPLPFAAQLPPEETLSSSAARSGGGDRSSGAHTPLASLQQPSVMVSIARNNRINDRGRTEHCGNVISDNSSDYHCQQTQDKSHDDEAMCVSDNEGERHSTEDCTTRDAEGDYSFRSSVESHWSAGTTPTGRSSGSSSCLNAAATVVANYYGSGHRGVPPIGQGENSSTTSSSSGFNGSVGGQCTVTVTPATSCVSAVTTVGSVAGHGYNTRSRCNSPHMPGIISSSTGIFHSAGVNTGRGGGSGCAELDEGNRSPAGGNNSPAGVSGQFKVYNTRSQSFGRGGSATQPS